MRIILKQIKKFAALGIAILGLSSCEVKAPILSGTGLQAVEVTEDKISLVYSIYPLLRVKTLKAEVEEETRKPVTLTEHEYPEGVKGIDMALVEGGSMEIQGKLVTLDSFYMNKYEMTTYVYTEAHNWAFQRGYLDWNDREWPHNEKENNTAQLMTLLEALATCNHLSLMENLTPVYMTNSTNGREPLLSEMTGFEMLYIDYSADGYRLPTEAEWEYAARGGQKSQGFIFSGSNEIDEVAWYQGNAGSLTDFQLVGEKRPNELGLYDMSGNASEWCIDIYAEPAVMEPGRNPGRVWENTREDMRRRYRLQKGGGLDMFVYYSLEENIELCKTGAREASNADFDPVDASKDARKQGTIRLVRNGG
jgi:formylglycine-generating enzyme required for sulfatase activity